MEKTKLAQLEMTGRAIFLGIVLAIVMAAANVYLGLKAGMTVSASIPAAVVAMGLLRALRPKGSILESNLVQTAASAGESLAAGIIFTMPALVIAGIWKSFDYWTTTLIAMTGGLLGILFMIPMRRVFVRDNKELAYPEGVACAEVLRAGDDEGSAGAAIVLWSMLVGGVFKFTGSFGNLFKSSLEAATTLGGRVFFIGCDVSPALIAVGYIVELKIAILIFIGGAIAWLVGIPLLDPGPHESAIDAAWTLWSTKIRYVGVGAMVVGGAHSIFQVRKGLVSAVTEIRKQFSSGKERKEETDRDISGTAIVTLSAFCSLMIIGIYYHLTKDVSATLIAGASMLILSFFMTAVASYIVGLVGNSNSPVSGMTITAVLVTGGLLYVMGYEGSTGILATLGVAGIVCCVACTSGDVCNDLKTGQIVGASPRRQQIMQILGVVAASFILAPVLIAMHEGSLRMGGTGIGGKDFPAPQANLFANLARGFFGGQALPWDMIAAGVGVGIAILITDAVLQFKKSSFRMHLMPVAVGIYLPFGLAVPILFGGLIAHGVGKAKKGDKASNLKRGVLVSSGIIAGESLVGVALAILAYFGVKSLALAEKLHLSGLTIEVLSAAALAGVCALFYRWSFAKN